MRKKETTALLLLMALLLPAMPGAASPEQAQEDGAIAPRPALAIPEGYRYDPGGRRDPFVNPVPPPPPPPPTGPVIPDVRPPGLPGVLLAEAGLMGVVASNQQGMNVVIIQAPGDRTFIARPGDELLDVVIEEIRSNSVIFEVKPREGSVEPAERERVERAVSPAPGE